MGGDQSKLETTSGLSFLDKLTVDKVIEVYNIFKTEYKIPSINYASFIHILSLFQFSKSKTPSDASLRRGFALLDSDRDGVVDSLEFFTSLILLCNGSLSIRMDALILLADFCGDKALSFDEVVLLVHSVCEGLNKFVSLQPVEFDVCALIGRQLFHDLRAPRHVRIPINDICRWWRRDGDIRLLLRRLIRTSSDEFGLPDEVITRNYPRLLSTVVGTIRQKKLSRLQLNLDKEAESVSNELL
eukprot:GDKJ01002058.1.p1 GENE.GDKJ01002058.1~~GDKJ01002058.1.p1  ORF type:complete len:243 (-),score=25.96 GDKJ01002058.1:20-748(-)